MLTEIQEASQATMEIYDDDPDHFEFLLKYMYTQQYLPAAISRMAGNDCVQRVTIPLGIYLVADKYNMPSSLFRKIIADLSRVLSRDVYTLDVLLSLVPLCYCLISKADHPFGKQLAKGILWRSRSVTSSEDFKNMVKAHPVFGADVALLLGEEKVSFYCEHCEELNKKFLPDAIGRMSMDCHECLEYSKGLSLSTAFPV